MRTEQLLHSPQVLEKPFCDKGPEVEADHRILVLGDVRDMMEVRLPPLVLVEHLANPNAGLPFADGKLNLQNDNGETLEA